MSVIFQQVYSETKNDHSKILQEKRTAVQMKKKSYERWKKRGKEEGEATLRKYQILNPFYLIWQDEYQHLKEQTSNHFDAFSLVACWSLHS
jgi:hypothetical protein